MTRFALLVLVLFTLTACGTSDADAPAAERERATPAMDSAQTVADVESAIRQFYVDVNEFDHAGIRRTTASDFEFMDGGRRMDGDAFEAFMRGIESGGTTLGFELSELNTEVEGDVAYTSYWATTPSSVYLEAAVLRRTDGGWIVDRVISAGVVAD